MSQIETLMNHELQSRKAVELAYEDEWILVAKKPAGLLVHGNGPEDESLESLVRRDVAKSAVLMHRLDRNTSGLVLFAKRREIAGALTQAIEQRRIRKAYLAVVAGEWPRSLNRIENRIFPSSQKGRMQSGPLEGEGASSLTTFRILASNSEKTWVEAILKTGRQHQIRVHCESAGHPILGDLLYGGGESGDAQAPLALHAYRMDLQHPKTKQELRITASPPGIWRTTWLSGLDFEPRWRPLFPGED